MNQFGGSWTDQKMDIVVSYAKAYLDIMKKQGWAKTIYFDGFAGSGSISDEETEEMKKGTALRILEIEKSFDIYYFVEKNATFQQSLKEQVKKAYPGKKAYVERGDCNDKLVDMAEFLRKNRHYRALAFIDPYGMAVKWSSIEQLTGLGIDLWILVPTGVGANRMLVNSGEIPDNWFATLEEFLGLNREEIKTRFYKQKKVNTLFESVTIMEKEKNSVQRLGQLYAERLKEVFDLVSDPYIMRNSNNSIMYHFMMATNNTIALKIANDVIKPKYGL